ncbi:MAG: PTS sugar transporter subunit IIB [Peptococcaceae bacterium]|jgi:PTS system mannose-specific IIB component|nr:PTS sugar transporter subunit IIB [Peptococcaceae bacterium]
MIALARIDERLVHGQVAVKWTEHVKANRIVVADDETSNNSMMRNLFSSFSPNGAKVEVLTVNEATARLLTAEYTDPSVRIMVLAKTPKPFLDMLEAGVAFGELNAGNMGTKPGRKKCVGYFHATDEELGTMKAIRAKGVAVYFQNICDMDAKKEFDAVVDQGGQEEKRGFFGFKKSK